MKNLKSFEDYENKMDESLNEANVKGGPWISYNTKFRGKDRFVSVQQADFPKFDWESVNMAFKKSKGQDVEATFLIKDKEYQGLISKDKQESVWLAFGDGVTNQEHNRRAKSEKYYIDDGVTLPQSWAIIRVQNPYGDRFVEYTWQRNDGHDRAILSAAAFKKQLKRSADNFASKKFIDHMGGTYTIYKDVEKFKAAYKRLTGNTVNLG